MKRHSEYETYILTGDQDEEFENIKSKIIAILNESNLSYLEKEDVLLTVNDDLFIDLVNKKSKLVSAA